MIFKAGLILEGGGMRGVYTAGVLDAFLDSEINFSHVYGVSAGACHACSFLSKQRGRAARTVIDFAGDPKYSGFSNLIKTGDFFGVKMVYDDIPNLLLPFDYETFNKSETEFYAVVTNCRTGKAEYLRISDMEKDIKIIQASSSLPFLSQMVEVDGELYLDGGVSDSIPVPRSIGDGNKKNVIILTRHKGYEKSPNKLSPVMKLKYAKYPALVKRMKYRHIQYNQTLKEIYRMEAEGKVIIVQPDEPVSIGRLEKNAEKLRSLYEIGLADGEKRAADIKKFMEMNEA